MNEVSEKYYIHKLHSAGGLVVSIGEKEVTKEECEKWLIEHPYMRKRGYL